MKKIRKEFTNPSKGISRIAFTLAEVLIVITIIGVVAAMTLPTLLDVNQEKVWNTSAEVFEAKMYQALKMMNVKGDLARLSSTEEFVQNLGKYFKIAKTCDNEHLTECFDKEVGYVSGDKVTNTKKLSDLNFKKAGDIGQTSWDSNIMGIQFPNGINGLIAYNDNNCLPKTGNKEDLMSCISLIYDVNAFAQPNAFTMDIRTINVPMAGDCLASTSSYCMALVNPSDGTDCTTSANKEACMRLDMYNENSTNTRDKSNRKVAANEMCRSMEMTLASKEQLTALYNELGQEYWAEILPSYGVNVAIGNTSGAVMGNTGCPASNFYVGGIWYNAPDLSAKISGWSSINCKQIDSTDFMGVCIKNK